MFGTETGPETVEVRLLGTVEATRGGEAVALGGRMQRTVLAALAAEAGERVSADRLVDVVWGESATEGARRSLQVYVSNLRSVLDPDRAGLITAEGDGYRLAGAPAVITDVQVLEQAADADGPASLKHAVDLWRGEPFGGVVDDRLGSFVVAWRERYLSTVEAWAAAVAASGQPSDPIPTLERLVADHPLRESLWEALVACLAGAGRSAEALESYRRVSDLLAEQGLEPSPSLRAMEDRVLLEDPTLLPDRSTETLPEGIVTFVFLDIEGSTRLLHRLGDGFHEVLDDYRATIERETSDRDGHVVSYEGDGAFLAFHSPLSAFETALAVLDGVAAADWPDGVVVRVRAGLHSGLASPRGGDYVAVAVHQASRVAGTARGGHVVVSETTAAFLPGLERLESIGIYRLRDFDEPVRLHLAAVDDEAKATPVRALPAERHNLAHFRTDTVGREDAIEEVETLIGPGRLVSLVGPGGVGKTRLAEEVSLRLSNKWDGGAWKIGLATTEDPDQIGSVMAEALGIPASGEPDLDNVVTFLGDRAQVIYLDNCEHLIEAIRKIVDRILETCPDVAVIATSREALFIEGEAIYRVAPLNVPTGSDLAEVRASTAGQLLEARARAAERDFHLTDENASTAARLCRLVDGLPLLIELAAAQTAYLELDDIVEGVTTSLDSLESRRTSIARHQTAHAVLEWGYHLLSPTLQRAFRGLAMFGSNFTVDMATAALGEDAPTVIWDLLDRSLVIDDRRSNESRYRMLRTVRMYGRSKATEAGDAGPTASAIARDLLDRVGPWLPVDGRWVSAVGQEADNLRALIEPLADAGEEETAQQIAVVLARHHNAIQTFSDGVEESSRMDERLPAPTSSRVALLAAQADLRLRLGDTDGATACVRKASELADNVGQPAWAEVAVERAAAELAIRSGDPAEAVSIAEHRLESPATARGRSRLHNMLGIASAGAGDLERAYAAFAEELAASEEAEADPWIPSAHGNLAEAAFLMGDLPAAARHQATALRLALEEGNTAMVALSLVMAARLAFGDESWETALFLQLAADRMLEDIGLAMFPEDAEAADDLRQSARSELGAEPAAGVESAAEAAGPNEIVARAKGVLEAAAD